MKYLGNCCAVILFFCLTCAGQKQIIPQRGACSYYGDSLRDSLILFSTVNEAERIINQIIGVIGLKPHFETRASDVPNAAAVIYMNKRYILYNPAFVEALNKAAGSKWAAVSILAHEIGHHLNGHTLEESGSRPEIELEADEFSGFVLRKLGATLAEAQLAMQIAADVKASHSHPAKAGRLKAIERGWLTADEQMSGKKGKTKSDPNITQPKVSGSVKKEIVLEEKYIAMDVQFDADPTGVYHVTVRGNLVKIAGSQLYIIGRMAKSNKRQYPLMFYDQYYNYLYITGDGVIMNGAGKKVGSIKVHKAAQD